MYKKILVALDGSYQAHKALLYAIEIANMSKAELLVLTIVPKISEMYYQPGQAAYAVEEWEAAIESGHKEILLKTENILNGYPRLKYRTMLKKGYVSKKILEIAKDENVDLIALGHRGMGGLKSMFLGSVCRHIVDHCEIPVLIVK
jgi:nucleotide-binding universal stress UspA family protein